MTNKEKAICNSFAIKEEFSQRSEAYHPPLMQKSQRGERNGKCKVFNQEEIIRFQLKHYPDGIAA